LTKTANYVILYKIDIKAGLALRGKWFAVISFAFILFRLLCASFASAEEAAAEEQDEQLVLTFAGDCTLGAEGWLQGYASSFVQVVREKGFDWPLSGVLDLFLEDDLTLVNLEGTFTVCDKAADKSFTFRAPPEFAEILPLGSVEAVNLANNHTMDYGVQGFEDTIAALDAQGVAHCGQDCPAVVEAKGRKIALLGFTYPLANARLTALYEEIEAYREREDIALIVVSFHWGREMTYEPRADQIRTAHAAIDHGADVVVGTHPHVLQSMEMYNGKPIFYSLGNFCFGGDGRPPDFDTAVMRLAYNVTDGGLRLARLEVIPCSISQQPQSKTQDFRPVKVEGDDAARILKKLSKGARGFAEGFFETGLWIGDLEAEP